ncbi:hypothetical protein [Thermaurantiacus sp.]
MTRPPLWLTLVPLLLGIAGWYLAWSQWRDRLETALLALLPAGTPIALGGFPYRLEARTGPVQLERAGEAVTARLAAEAMVVNRQPWRVDRQVINLAAPRIALTGLRGATLGLEAPSAQASLRFDSGWIARASAVFEAARLRAEFLPVPARAERLEVHVRETPANVVSDQSATLPVQAQLILSAVALRFGEGEAVSLSAALDLTARAPVRRVATWQAGGTAELRELVIADREGEVVRVSGTFSPGADRRLLFAGSVETVCPASVRAALLGSPPVSEKRTRKPVRFALTAVLGELAEPEAPVPGAVAPPVRAQAPDCPRLR